MEFDKNFSVGEKFFLRVHPQKSLIHYGKGSHLLPHFVGSFEILERSGLVFYRLALPPNLACIHDVSYVLVLS